MGSLDQQSPGVVTREIDLSNYVTAEGINGGAFVGSFTWGPVLHDTVVSDELSLTNTFGKPTETNYIDWYCANDFLAYTNDLSIVRVVDQSAKNSTTEPLGGSVSGVLIKNEAHFQAIAAAGLSTNAVFAARYPGALGNSLKISVCDEAGFEGWTYKGLFPKTAPGTSTFVKRYGGKSDELHLVVIDEDGLFTGVKGTVLEKYAYLSKCLNAVNLNGAMNFYGNVLNRNSKYVWYLGPVSTITSGRSVNSVTVTDPGAGYPAGATVVFGAPTIEHGVRATGTVTVGTGANAGKITAITITNKGSGYSSAPTITILDSDGEAIDPAPTTPFTYTVDMSAAVVNATAFNKVVKSVTITAQGSGYSNPTLSFSAPGEGGVTATGYPDVRDGKIVAIVITNQGSGYTVAPTMTLGNVGSGSGFAHTVVVDDANDDEWATTVVSPSGVPREYETLSTPYSESFVGGTDGSAPTADDLIDGWNIYSSTEGTNVSLLITGAMGGAGSYIAVAQHLIDNIVEKRKDCVAFFSPKAGDVLSKTQSEAVEAILATRDSIQRSTNFGVMDSGWKLRFDKFYNRYVWLPLNADVAGLCAATDKTNDPWWSPAGYNRGRIKNCIRLAFNPNQTSRDDLYQMNVNSVVTFTGEGTVLYGDRTMQLEPSAFSYINVRRLFIVLEKSIAKASKYQLFEFNDQFTRAQFISIVDPFLRDVQGRRGIYAYKIVCDEKNNTPEVIDRGEFVASIFIKPARSINFITLNFVASKTGVNFDEDISIMAVN